MRKPWFTRVVLLPGLLAGLSCASALTAAPARGATSAVVPAEAPAPDAEAVDVTSRRTRDLRAACLAEQGAASGWCSAYLMGVADTLAAFGTGGHKGGICDAEYTIETLAETFLTWSRANDGLLGVDMLAGASLAFRQRWPCRQ
ncbi:MULTISPECIES: Rap1a/Tai family immunity protein [Methylobacteriaceae]|uniref:Rap1a/Tai family immunity protein n=1 Tax=Methylobacteriaceae TaxID=119045 RepID=UPI00117544C4|nr:MULTISPECIES: Rap1a/Tai family immunity protein [Methylobacteriaceae]GEL42889.1 hypothetical protein MEX01_34800 [Methylorubrum extorquens]